MKVLHLTKKYPDALGGDAVVVANLEREQKKQGMEVSILTHHFPELARGRQVSTFGLPIPSADLDRITARRLVSLLLLPLTGFFFLKRTRPDIFHSHSADLGFAISLPARLFKIPVVNTCHGVSLTDEKISFFKKHAEIFFLKHGGFARIITVDSRSVRVLEENGIAPVVYIPNGVHPASWETNRKYYRHGTSESLRFLFVGRLEEQKGLPFLLEAARELPADTVNFTLRIIGDGSHRQYLAELADALGIGDRVIFSGRVSPEELKKAYQAADVFVLPSLWEGMPITLLEAWASGLPVIVTSVGNIPDICVHGENAWIVEPGNPEQLRDAMVALAASPELRERLGRNGMREVREKYSWGTIAERTVGMYRDVMRG